MKLFASTPPGPAAAAVMSYADRRALAQRPGAHGALLPATRDRGFSRTKNAASRCTDQHELPTRPENVDEPLRHRPGLVQAGFVVCCATIIVS